MRELNIGGKYVRIYPALDAASPIIYLNTVQDESDSVKRAMEEIRCPDCTLTVIGGLNWNDDMSPWECSPIFQKDVGYGGKAESYLKILTNKIIPAVEKPLPDKPLYRGIAGYSLSGLFALYSLYISDAFSAAASISGSLWFPDFDRYIYTHEMKSEPHSIYFSLGDRECKTKNSYLKQVQEKTENISDFYRKNGLNTCFFLNSGGHFQNPAERTAAGIKWTLER